MNQQEKYNLTDNVRKLIAASDKLRIISQAIIHDEMSLFGVGQDLTVDDTKVLRMAVEQFENSVKSVLKIGPDYETEAGPDYGHLPSPIGTDTDLSELFKDIPMPDFSLPVKSNEGDQG